MNIIIMSILAGVVGMGLGGIITAVFGTRTDKMIGIFLSFAGGVMASIVFLELLPESIEYSNIWITVIGLLLGVAMVFGLHGIIDKISSKAKSKLGFHESYAEFFHSSGVIDHKKSMLRSGMVMIIAIALHNIPEGLAMGAAGYHDAALGLTLAIMIGLHNIPEGMAISAPLISGGLSKTKTVLLAFLTGSTTLIGTIAGILIGGISDTALALSFSAAGGAMLYVVFAEILPQSIVVSKDKVPAIFALIGIITGMLFTQI